MLRRLIMLFLFSIVGCGSSESSSGDGSSGSSGNSGTGGTAGSNAGGGGTGGSAAATGGSGGVDCDCALGAYIPVCGVDGMTHDATCGVACVPVDIQCRGECPCDGSGGGGGAGGSSGAGAGGSGGDASCTNPDSGTFAVEYETRGTTVGQNGSFSDECDADGDLVEYGCEVDSSTCMFPNPSPGCYRVTGRVAPAMIDCGGTCEAGACASLCAHTGDEFTYESIDRTTGAATLRNLNREAVYVCELTWDRTTDEFDCTADPSVGDTTAVVAFGAATTFCLSGEPSGFGVQPEGTTRQECSYECTTQ
jgi:hypothetical protein